MKLQIMSDGIVGQETSVWLDGETVDDVLAIQFTMSASGLNTVVMQRMMNEGLRVELELIGGEAFHDLRKAAITVLASEALGTVAPEVLANLRAAVAAVQQEVSG